MARLEVVEFTDPWCSWAWGSEPKLRLLRWCYGDRLAWRQVMADLLPRPGPEESHLTDTEGAAAQAAAYWCHVSRHTGMPWPDRLRWAPCSSDVASRAVTAARLQSGDLAEKVLRALRESLFVFCAPADTPERVIALARAIPGLDPDRLAADLDSPPVVDACAAHREEARRPNDYVLGLAETNEGNGNARPDGASGRRYATPTLIVRSPVGDVTVPGWQPWERYEEAIELALPGSTTAPRPRPSPDEALLTWPLLAQTELEFLCGPGCPPPANGEALPVGGGLAWIRRDDPRRDSLPASRVRE